jgi:hypothetical protein
MKLQSLERSIRLSNSQYQNSDRKEYTQKEPDAKYLSGEG